MKKEKVEFYEKGNLDNYSLWTDFMRYDLHINGLPGVSGLFRQYQERSRDNQQLLCNGAKQQLPCMFRLCENADSR